jgi:hypothetical protein
MRMGFEDRIEERETWFGKLGDSCERVGFGVSIHRGDEVLGVLSVVAVLTQLRVQMHRYCDVV